MIMQRRRWLSFLLAVLMVLAMLPPVPLTVRAAENSLEGKTISILGDSISTFEGVSDNPDYNSTLSGGAIYFTPGRWGVNRADTWWQQTIDALGLELCVNNSWSGSAVLHTRRGTAGAYVSRCVQLHNDHTSQEPDIIVVYMGGNDFNYYQDTLGDANIDYDALIRSNGDGTFTYAEPTTTCEAYAIILRKIKTRYPDAQVYCMASLPRRDPDKDDGYPDLGQPTAFNAARKEIATRFEIPVVDLENCGISKDAEIFDQYIGDGRTHPNADGMDLIAQALIRTLLGEKVTLYDVSGEYSGVDTDNGAAAAVSGMPYTATLTAQSGYAGMDVTITMGGADVTDDVYSNGKIHIESVTGNIVIQAAGLREPQTFRWELTDGALVSTGMNDNPVTYLSGTVTGGVLKDARYRLETAVELRHDRPWSIEWKCAGNWRGVVFSTNPPALAAGRCYLTRTKGGQLCFGTWDGDQYHNFGIDLSGLDSSTHTYLLENRIAEDGSNMVWLWVDGEENGPMNRYFIGSKDQGAVADWLSGRDFTFTHIGSDSTLLTDCTLSYLQVTECGHTYENGTCTGCGAKTSPYLQQLPENTIGCTNLYDSLTPVKGYYTATKYDTSNGAVLSVVIPVEPGDRIAASSFGPVSENMGSVDGIRVTYLLGDEIVTSLSAGYVYNGYTSNGCITVPDGVDAVCVPWWKPSDRNWLTLSQISKDFAVHSPKTVAAQAPTCTEKGYTAGEICEVCSASLCGRTEIPPTGHTYSGDTCTICGAVNLEAILGGKYVSILGDSISTFNGYSNDSTVNSTIGGNGPRYDAGAADTKPGSYCLLESVNDTWWMHFANRSGMKLLVNNSWAGSQVFGGKTSDGRVIPAAYLDRCVNLHDNTLENNPGNTPINPDVIFVYLGINDYNFNRSKVGTGAVDYAGLVSSDGTYAIPETFGEAYGIMLHKMRRAYPDARIFAMTLLPENLYSVDKTAWEQHNAYIRAAAEYYEIPVVDLAKNCAITWENYSGYMIDKIHPTTAGMKLISDCIEAELAACYQENPPHTHAYTSTVTAPTCTEQGYTTYTCDCGDSYVDDYVDAAGHTYENGICTGCGDININWEIGTIAAANGANSPNTTRLRTTDYLAFADFSGVSVNVGYQLTWLAYDAEKNYIGNGTATFTGYWQPSGQSIATADIQNLYSNAVYFRLALKAVSGGSMTLEDVQNSGVTFIPFGEALPEPEYELEYESSLNIGSWQDGAIWNGKLFVLGGSGTGAVYDLKDLSKLAAFSLDSADVLKPHANSVCFGSTYYAPGDKYPLLYVNVYNNYASAADRMEGTCCVYRITETDSGFVTELVQVIEIGFTEDLTLWKSKENNGDVRPYGNFLVDTEENKLYAYVMRDATNSTRFFKFDLPELTDGIYSETYGCNVVTLESADIERQFDTEYFNYLQGGTYSSGMILSAEGFNSGSSAEPAIRIIDLQTGTVSATYYMANSGLTAEPEVICVDPATGLLYYAPADGTLRILTIPDVHFHTYENGICTACGAEHPNLANFEGKVISILGGSNCTFEGYIPAADGFNLAHRSRYPDTSRIPDVTEVGQTWWMQLLTAMDAKLGINDSWAGSQVLNTMDSNSGDLGPDAAMASLTRIQNLGANGTPDVILFFGGCNDIGRSVKLGSFDPAAAPTEADLTVTKWETFADAYVAAITRMRHFYPDAQILVMLPYNSPTYFTASKVEQYGAVIRSICDHYGVAYVDLRDSGIDSSHLPDNIHPNAAGCDLITTAVLDALLDEIKLEDGEHTVYPVTHNLTNAGASLHYYKGISAGKTFRETISGEDLTVTVTMGGVDITDTAYADSTISISDVSGDLVITARGRFDADGRLQQLPENICGGTNLWPLLEHQNEYYTADGWGNNSNSNYSVTIPVTPGDRIRATSFGAAGTNGYSANAVRITWFSEDGVLESVGRDAVYAEFKANSFVTAPEGAVAVNIPMASNDASWELYILNLEHPYESVVTQPTCTESGFTTHTCACGDNFVDSWVDALGHSFGEWKVTTAPSCTEPGQERRDCENCDHYETRELAATGHAYKSVVTDPTCTERGFTTHTCACGDSYVDTWVDALGHRFGEWKVTTTPTCTEPGQERRDCENCDHHETREIAATGHDYTSVVTPPTCTENGFTTHTCTICGDSFVDSRVDATGHSWSEWAVVQEPTTTAPGLRQRSCARCEETEQEAIPKLESIYGDANADGNVNALDLILLRQYLAGWNVEPDMTAADANGDGTVNALDLILLRQYLAGWAVILGPKS